MLYRVLRLRDLRRRSRRCDLQAKGGRIAGLSLLYHGHALLALLVKKRRDAADVADLGALQ